MPGLIHILTDPSEGLLPYLDAGLSETINRLQVRPWNFNGIDATSGFRVPETQSDDSSNAIYKNTEVRIGKIFPITSNINSTTEKANFSEAITELLHKSKNCVSNIDRIDKVTSIKMDKQSQGAAQWYAIVVVKFDLKYYYD